MKFFLFQFSLILIVVKHGLPFSIFKSNLCLTDLCRTGECEQFKNSFKCHCDQGNKGKHCEYIMKDGEDPCLSNPCWNNGECYRTGLNEYRCECLADFGGKNCKELRNSPCLTNKNVCKNNGVCIVSSLENITCQCINDWTGQYCETKLPVCSDELDLPCYNGGICTNNNCHCPENFYGKRCETFDMKRYELIVKSRLKEQKNNNDPLSQRNTIIKCRV